MLYAALIAAMTHGPFTDLPMPDPPPIICAIGEPQSDDWCADAMLDIDTIIDYGGTEQNLYQTQGGPGPLVVGFHQDGVFIETHRVYYFVRSPDVGRLILVPRDGDMIFRETDTAESALRWSSVIP